jgi:alanyl-tRNA synthetase
MGLERLAMLMQGRNTIFDTDVFIPLVERVLAKAGHEPAQMIGPIARDARIIADHVRALTFAIGEGALPGNEGAGYVLRRLLRRAVTRGRAKSGLAMREPFLASCAERAIEIFGDHYVELTQHAKEILGVLEREETKFAETFEAGLTRLEELLASRKGLSGDDAFMLHDTYGFPIELTEEIAAERGVPVDRGGFDRAMQAQRERARTSSKFAQRGGAETGAWTEVGPGGDSEFLGYRTLTVSGVTLRRWREVEQGLEVVLDRTPFYAESGGQVADRGGIRADGLTAAVTHVFREADHIVHRVRLDGDRARWLAAGAEGRLEAHVDPAHRLPTQRHHTATHMLHASLRGTLGTHVRQAGSLVAPDRLRFDYTHFEAPSPEQLSQIEHRVAEWALRNTPVSWEVMPLETAKALGAMALFGEKYGAEVRVVTVPGVETAGIPDSRELCGGTHVSRTGDIGPFVLVSDSAIASGVRRIEALCGHEALGWLKSHAETLARAAAAFQVKPEAVPQQVEKLKADLERLRKAQAEAEKGGLEAEMTRIAAEATTAPGGRWVVARLTSEADINAARDAADRLRGALKRGAAVLAIGAGGKVTLLAAVTDDLVAEKKLNASDLVKKVAQVAGGSGGGKPHLALAGAKDAAKVDEALAEARRMLTEALG